jgi:N-carbamoyl-L-amino-acid hydrolase
MQIDAGRLLDSLEHLRTFGAYKTGVHRPTYSAPDIAARRWLADSLADVGLNAQVDGIGNVFGESTGGSKLLIGSHLESLNHAGWLDGALGVAYALEVATLRPDLVDVAAWADEEGHYGSFLGSRSFVGALTEQEIDNCRNRYDELPLRDALRRADLHTRSRKVMDPTRYSGYFEAHIEQGIELEQAGKRVGIVTRLVGVWQYRITVTGEQNHAGTTSMARRKDAGATAIRLAAALDDTFRAVAALHTVWTFGSVHFDPGQLSVIPGRAVLCLQFRDSATAVLDRLEQSLVRAVHRENETGPCRVQMETLSKSMPALMHPELQACIQRAAAARVPGQFCHLPSGAQHDAQILATVLPSAMLFVPSIGGISHHWHENTSEQDIVLGCQVYADAVELMSGLDQPKDTK